MTTNIKTLQFKVLKLERRLKGLCLNCGAPAKVKADGTKARLCADCMKKNYKYSAAYHQRKRQEKAIEDNINKLLDLKEKLKGTGYIIKNEPKSKKTQVAFQPSLFVEVKRTAEKEGQSFNEMLHILLREALERRELEGRNG